MKKQLLDDLDGGLLVLNTLRSVFTPTRHVEDMEYSMNSSSLGYKDDLSETSSNDGLSFPSSVLLSYPGSLLE